MAGSNQSKLSEISEAKVQKLLADPKNRIELHNVIHSETEKAYESLEAFSVQAMDVVGVAKLAIPKFESATETLRMVVAYGSYFGTRDQAYLWSGALNRLSKKREIAGSTFLIKLQLYPALLVLYAGGISALAANNSESLKALLGVQATDINQDSQPLILTANCTMLEDLGNQLLDMNRRKTPLSDHLNELFASTLPSELTFGKEFEQLFDEWEILVSMVVADILHDRVGFSEWAPVGRFAWRDHHSNESSLKVIRKKLDQERPEWVALDAGLFGGSTIRARDALNVVEKFADRVSFF